MTTDLFSAIRFALQLAQEECIADESRAVCMLNADCTRAPFQCFMYR